MTPEAQRIAIAEACGWEDCKVADKIGLSITKTIVATNDNERAKANRRAKRGLANWPYVEVPDYLNDLNAMHEAESKLNNSIDSKVYGQWLVRITQGFDVISRDDICLNYWALVSVARATAAQRAEAFLRTLNL